jgi:hypothetical protein
VEKVVQKAPSPCQTARAGSRWQQRLKNTSPTAKLVVSIPKLSGSIVLPFDPFVEHCGATYIDECRDNKQVNDCDQLSLVTVSAQIHLQVFQIGQQEAKTTLILHAVLPGERGLSLQGGIFL